MTLPLTFVPEGSMQVDIPVNDSFQLIAALCQSGAVSRTNSPPTTTLSDVGKIWIIGTAPSGVWTDNDNAIALCTAANVWRFLIPSEGWLVRDLNASEYRYFDGSAWQIFSGGGAVARDSVTPLSTSGSVDIDVELGDYFTIGLTGDVSALTFSNLPASGKASSIMIEVTQDSTPRTVAWPASFTWAGGSAPSVSTAAGAVDVLALTTFDQGVTWRATLAKAFS